MAEHKLKRDEENRIKELRNGTEDLLSAIGV